jgi:hypothetical protein
MSDEITATSNFVDLPLIGGEEIIPDDYDKFSGLFNPLPKTITISIGRAGEFPTVFIDAYRGQILLKPTEIQNGFLIYTFHPVSTDIYRVFIDININEANAIVTRKKNVPINSSNL